MTERMSLDDAREEFRVPEAKAFFMALVPAMSIRMRMTDALRQRGFASIRPLDQAISFHIFVWEIAGGGGGTRQGAIVDHFVGVPRGTVRESLKRQVRQGILHCAMVPRPGGRTASPLYHPGPVVAEIANEFFEENMLIHIRMANAFAAYRERLGR
jgi:hypothetical protein